MSISRRDFVKTTAIAMLQDDGKSLEQVLGKLPRP